MDVYKTKMKFENRNLRAIAEAIIDDNDKFQ